MKKPTLSAMAHYYKDCLYALSIEFMAVKTEIDELPQRIKSWEKHVDENLVEADCEASQEYAVQYEGQYVGEVHHDTKTIVINADLEDHAKYAYPEYDVQTVAP